MLLNCLILAVMAAGIKYMQSWMDIFSIIFWINFIAFIICLMLAPRFLGKKVSLKRLKPHIARALSGIISFSIYFWAITIIPISEATAISFMEPIFASLIAIITLKEKASHNRIIAMIAGFIGVVIILRPGTAAFQPVSLLILFSALLWAISAVNIKKMSKYETANSQAFYLFLFSWIFAIPQAVYKLEIPDIISFALLILLSIILVIRVMATYFAFRGTDVAFIMPFTFSKLIFASLIDFFIFKISFDLWDYIGAIIITLSAVYLANIEKKNEKIPA